MGFRWGSHSKKVVAGLLTAATLLGTAGLAFADDGGQSGNASYSAGYYPSPVWVPPGLRKHLQTAAPSWAQGSASFLYSQGILQGMGGNHLGLNQNISREQLVVLLGRLSGWQQQALQTAQQQNYSALSRFSNWQQTAPYARGYMEMAVGSGVIQGLSSGNLGAHQQVTWAELAVILARALKLPKVAASQVPAELQQLQYGLLTPSWAQEAVARDVQAGLFTGVIGQLYRPNAKVTRAEMSVLLTRADGIRISTTTTTSSTGSVQNGAVAGSLTSVQGTSLVLQESDGSSVTYPVVSAASVYLNGQTSSLGSLPTGAQVVLSVVNGQAVVVDATSSTTAPTPAPSTGTVQGTISSMGTGTIVVSTSQGTDTYTLLTGAAVTLNGQNSSLAALTVGDTATLYLYNGEVAAINANGTTSNPVTSTLSGLLTAVTANSVTIAQSVYQNGTTSITVTTVPVASTATVTLNNASSSLGNVVIGEPASVGIDASGDAVSLTASSPASAQTVSGTLEATADGSVLAAQVNGQVNLYLMASGAPVFLNGAASSLSTLAAGTPVVLSISAQGLVTLVSAS